MIQKFSDIKENQVSLVGGKGLSLARMAQAKLPVPSGFVVTTEAFDRFANSDFESEFIEHLYRAFDELASQRVAVRSSAIAEDSSTASWAGQLETYLNVEKAGLAEAIRKCWYSIKSERATQYAIRQKTDKQSLKMAVVVQSMIDSEVAGVMFTANPMTSSHEELMIEASFGLGEMIVQGEVTPDNYIVSRDGKIISKTINKKDQMMEWKDGSNVVSNVPDDKRQQYALNDEQINELATLGGKVQDYYGAPQDIEWCLHENRFFIVQARPITTLGTDTDKASLTASEDRIITTGIGASHGIATGKVRLIKDLSELGNIQEGEVLVTHKTTPDYVEAFSKAVAVATESGGATSHAAIVSRELGIPAVVGTGDITLKVKNDDVITVDGSAGYIYSGEVQTEAKASTTFSMPQPSGDDIEDMINAIASGINDANELWPLGPAQLMTYIDADQSVDMYQKLKQLHAEGMSEHEIAKLFERPIYIKMFLLNTGVVGMKSANVYEKRATIDDQVDFVKKMLSLAKVLNQNDDHYIVSRNYLWDKNQVSAFIKENEWSETDNRLSKAINVLSVNLLALNWAMYWDYFPEAGHELHGPYEVSEFGKSSRIVVKDYFNLGSGEVWEHAKDYHYKEVRLAQVYSTDKMYINFGNRLVGQELSNHTTHFALLVNGEPVKSLERIEEMSAHLKQMADKQTKYVNSLEPMELVRKGAKISYFTRKKFYLHFNKDWYPEEMIEGTIKAVGTKFVDDFAEAKPMSMDEKKKMWNPRNEWLP